MSYPKFITKYRITLLLVVILLFFAADYFIYTELLDKQTDLPEVASYDIIQSGFGERKIDTLADNTVVILNAHTTLKIPKDSSLQHQVPELDGDAFFIVAGTNNDSFVVHTGMLNISARAASFRIHAHHEDAGQTIELLSGKAKVAKSYPSQFHEPEFPVAGEMVMINKDIDLMEKETFDTTLLSHWLKDDLIFNKVSFDQVIKRLENWYDIEIVVSGDPFTPEHLTISGEYKQAGLQTVLDSLSNQLKFRYKIKQNKVEISAR